MNGMGSYNIAAPLHYPPLVDWFLHNSKPINEDDYRRESNDFELRTAAKLVASILDAGLREKFCQVFVDSYDWFYTCDVLPKESKSPEEWGTRLRKAVSLHLKTNFTSSSSTNPNIEMKLLEKKHLDHLQSQAERVPELEDRIRKKEREIEELTQQSKIKKELADTLYFATQKQANPQYDSDYKKLCRDIMDIPELYNDLTANKTDGYDFDVLLMLNIIGELKYEDVILKGTYAKQLDKNLCGGTKDRSKYILYKASKNTSHKKITKCQLTNLDILINSFKNP